LKAPIFSWACRPVACAEKTWSEDGGQADHLALANPNPEINPDDVKMA
jgi:hypothetical protein